MYKEQVIQIIENSFINKRIDFELFLEMVSFVSERMDFYSYNIITEQGQILSKIGRLPYTGLGKEISSGSSKSLSKIVGKMDRSSYAKKMEKYAKKGSAGGRFMGMLVNTKKIQKYISLGDHVSSVYAKAGQLEKSRAIKTLSNELKEVNQKLNTLPPGAREQYMKSITQKMETVFGKIEKAFKVPPERPYNSLEKFANEPGLIHSRITGGEGGYKEVGNTYRK